MEVGDPIMVAEIKVRIPYMYLILKNILLVIWYLVPKYILFTSF